jgi:coproporphyrinogen III oxidase-like Fe-S oxidoreductase
MNRTALSNFESEIHELAALGLLEHEGNCLRLTARGRLLSNEVFERFIATDGVALDSI